MASVLDASHPDPWLSPRYGVPDVFESAMRPDFSVNDTPPVTCTPALVALPYRFETTTS